MLPKFYIKLVVSYRNFELRCKIKNEFLKDIIFPVIRADWLRLCKVEKSIC